jgi:hypothetical protein
MAIDQPGEGRKTIYLKTNYSEKSLNTSNKRKWLKI